MCSCFSYSIPSHCYALHESQNGKQIFHASRLILSLNLQISFKNCRTEVILMFPSLKWASEKHVQRSYAKFLDSSCPLQFLIKLKNFSSFRTGKIDGISYQYPCRWCWTYDVLYSVVTVFEIDRSS